ncbi:fibronectin type III domain-containing protein [Candidatus Nomurabacteria bacterium]|nr:fibronectin type III domain-containing protein [Candidatus Nomurabacteria bacterium]
MKNNKRFFAFLFAVLGFFVTSHKVEAAVSFNNVGNDCRTVAIANFTTNQGFTNPCWPNSTVSGSAGDVLNVRIYYHNTGTSSAADTRIKLIQNTSGSATTHSLTGSVSSSGVVAQGGVSATLSTAQTLTPVSALWYPNQTSSNPTNLPINDVMSANGASIGTIAPGWGTQGSVVIVLQVSAPTAQTCTDTTATNYGGPLPCTYQAQTCTNPAATNYGGALPCVFPPVVQIPTVTTNTPSASSATTGYFSGYYSGANVTSTGFDYYQSGWTGNVMSVNASTSTSFTASVSNLTPNTTYYVRAKATNTAGTGYGIYMPFTTPANQQTIYACSDGIDNDGDGYTDSQDPACAGNPNGSTEYPFNNLLPTVYQCSNGIDDDGDSFVDMQDPGCSSSTDNTESPFNYPQVTLPYVTTLSAQAGQNSATLYGTYSGTSVTSTGFDYYQSGWTGNIQSVNAPLGTSFSQVVSGLQANTTYYVRAKATNSAGTGYGTYLSFTTNAVVVQTCTDYSATNYGGPLPCVYPQALTVVTNQPTNIGQTYATFSGSYYGGYNGSGGILLPVMPTGYFQYGTSSSFGMITPSTIAYSSGFTSYVSNLTQNTTYYVRACVNVMTGNSGVVCGNTVTFTTTGTIYQQYNLPSVTTYTATNVAQNYATFNGYIDMQGSYGSRYFQYGTNINSLNYSTPSQTAYTGNVSELVSNLMPNTTYYFRLVGTNTYGTNYGQVYSFVTSGNTNIPYNGPQSTLVLTTVATNVGQSSARLNGVIRDAVVGSQMWFEYGADTGLGLTTTAQTVQSSFVPYYDAVFNLEPNIGYYYRAVARINGVVINGDIVSFRTLSIKAPVVVTPAGTGTGTGSTNLMLEIKNKYKVACAGDSLDYEITYKNLSKKTLTDAVIQIHLPKELKFVRATDGSYDSKDYTLTIALGTLAPDATGTHFMQVKATEETKDTTVVSGTLQVTMPDKVQDSIIAYDISDDATCATNGLGAAALFGAGFFPQTLGGWLLLILIILLIIVAVRQTVRKTVVQ